MKAKEFRELQVSSTQLAIIFIIILVLGTVIFLLGVSVGKKQTEVALKETMALPGELAAAPEKIIPEPVKTEPAEAAKSIASPVNKEPFPQALEKKAEPGAEKPPAVQQAVKPAGTGRYYIQVGAFRTRKDAAAVAERFKKQGHTTMVLEPFPRDKRSLFRVWLGDYPTKEEAESVKPKLPPISKKPPDYYVVKD